MFTFVCRIFTKSKNKVNNFYISKRREMACLPPRKISAPSKISKHDTNPLQILLQMGFPKHRALKALAATGNRSVQLASDWLLTHVNDAYLDAEAPREYILYACPSGPLLTQLLNFWEKSKVIGWNGAHNFPPHITLVSFFKAPDDSSLQLGKAVKHVVESVGEPPACTLKLEPYMSHNFMGLFISEEHAEYLKKIAVQYVKQVSSATICLEPHVKSLHITLAYHFAVSAYDPLKTLVDAIQPLGNSNWELRLYSRDPRFDKHQVHRVSQSYAPKESDELELVHGDYVYIDEKEIESSPDGWVQGTSWLTGVTGYLPAVYTQRTAESDAWTLHRATALTSSNSPGSKSESDSATEGESDMAGRYPHSDAAGLAQDKSEESFQEWEVYWTKIINDKFENILTVTDGTKKEVKDESSNGSSDIKIEDNKVSTEDESSRRWMFALRHGERIDLTYGSWVPFCFDEDKYVRKDLNMPLKMIERAGGKEAFAKDTPLTRVGWLQAYLVGEGMRLAGMEVKHVYASAALRCIETAHSFLEGLQADPSVKIKVEPGLFEYKLWHPKGLTPFMSSAELIKAGYNVDPSYKPYVDLDINTPETLEQFHNRNELVTHSAYRDTESEGGNIIFVGHASTLDTMWQTLRRLGQDGAEFPSYNVSKNLVRVPYCAVAAMRDKPWQLVAPPCPPSINSSSGRFDWTILNDS